jgi:hypothetical protein
VCDVSEPHPPWHAPTRPLPTQHLGYPPAVDPYEPYPLYRDGYGDTLLGPPEPAPRRRRRRTLFIALGAVVALLVSGAAVAGAAVWYGWGATEPEDVLPGSSIAFARVDLSPGLGQALALQSLARKFPSRPGGDDLVAQAEQNLTRELLAPLDFQTDVKPWLGDRLGTALWSPGGSATCTLTALASTDDAKARAALARVAGITYDFRSGYAVLARCDHGGTVSQALADAAQQSLSAQPAFGQAKGQLPGGQAVLAWINGSQYRAVAPASGTGLNGSSVLVGMKATDAGLELRARIHSTSDTTDTAGADALSQLDGLPGASVVGLAADLRGVRGLNGDVTTALDDLLREVHGGLTDLDRFVHDVAGSTVSLSLVDPESPAVKLLVKAGDGASAADLAGLLRQTLGPARGEVAVTGNTVSLTSPRYQGGSGRLADNPLYRAAMADPPANVVLAGYANVTDLAPSMKLTPDEAAQLAPVHAVGLSLGSSGGSAQLLLRVVIS